MIPRVGIYVNGLSEGVPFIYLFFKIQLFCRWLDKSLRRLVIIITIPVFIHEFLVKLAYSVKHGY